MTATLTTLVSFDGANGGNPQSELIADSAGDLFGATWGGGANDLGTVFEIKKTVSGYASLPTTLVSFSGANGASPIGSLIADAGGDLFGVTQFGGANGDGTVFEIKKTAAGYASAPTTLVSFSGANGANPLDALLADSNGDLFGTTSNGGANNHGTVFEIAKTASGYASTPNTLVSFDSAASPAAGLIADSNGDLFGTTQFGGPRFLGTVFEIKKTGAGYASVPTTLVSFNAVGDGSRPFAGLIANANGDLFGTTSGLGPNGLPFPPAREARYSRSKRRLRVTRVRRPPWSGSTPPKEETPRRALSPTPGAICSGRQEASVTTARCSRSRTPPRVTPALPRR